MSHLLVVDDDDAFRTMLRLTLQKFGHMVAEASNGEEALRLHEETAFDVLLIDILMPQKEGIETILEIRKQRPGAKIIAISGGGSISAKELLYYAKNIGANLTLAKPFSDEALIDALAQLDKKS